MLDKVPKSPTPRFPWNCTYLHIFTSWLCKNSRNYRKFDLRSEIKNELFIVKTKSSLFTSVFIFSTISQISKTKFYVRGWIDKYPCLKTDGIAERSWKNYRALTSFKRRHTKFQNDSLVSFDLTDICNKHVWCFSIQWKNNNIDSQFAFHFWMGKRE